MSENKALSIWHKVVAAWYKFMSRRDLTVFGVGKGEENQDLDFMSDVSVALRYTGRSWTYWASALALLIFFVGIIIAGFIQRDEVTRGNGQFIPSLGIQPVQSPESGVISKIYVKENQRVAKDQVLADISNVEAMAGYNELLNRKVEMEFTIRRLRAEQQGVALEFSDTEKKEYPEAASDQLMLFAARLQKYEQDSVALRAQLAVKNYELQEALLRRKQYEQSLLLLREQESKVRPLVQARAYSEVDYLNLRQRIVSQEGDLNGLAQTIFRIRSTVQETEVRLANLEPERQAAIATELQASSSELGGVTERLASGKHKVDSRVLLAPMDGTIKRILLKEQSVARQAEMVMELVPSDDTLEVDAKFRPADRSYLVVDQKATIKVSAYDFSIYGTLDAHITSISPDTIEDNKGEPWYYVRLRTTASKLPYPDKDLQIEPGMTVVVDVLSGKKSVLTYLLKPVFKTKTRTNMAVGTNATAAPQQ